MKNKFIIFIVISILLSSCAKEEQKISKIKETDQNQEMIATYKEAYKALEKNDIFFAAKKFLEAELLYPQSLWAPKSALMAAYSYYLQNYYSEALNTLDRYLKTYPTDVNQPYAHYLIGMCHYESIEDEKRDSAPLIKAKNKFNFVINEYPNTDFALDAKFKLDLIDETLAGKEMYIGRYYIKKEKWIAAINRFKYVVDNYNSTIYIEEALHRLVELHYKIGLIEESKKYAAVLGYNYQSGEWYEVSYQIFNKEFEPKDNSIKPKKGNFIFKKFKNLFEN